MCKFTIPQVDANATNDERRKAYFDALYSTDLSEEVEKKNGLTDMYYECCCADITIEEWKHKMKGIKPINYQWLVRQIKKHLPYLYESLMLDVYNPYQEKCGVNRDYYVLVHSAIEYFIKKK